MTSLCDTCSDPGVCCKFFRLFGIDEEGGEMQPAFSPKLSAEDVTAILHAEYSLPFRAIAQVGKDARDPDLVNWAYGCSLLDENGRCSDYVNRPEVCHSYTLGQDHLCVYYKTKDKTAEEVPKC